MAGQLFSQTGVLPSRMPINVWIQQPRFGYSYWWANGALYSNELGQFTAAHIPSQADVTIHAGHNGWVQPCAAGGRVPELASVQIELMPDSAFDTLTAPAAVDERHLGHGYRLRDGERYAATAFRRINSGLTARLRRTTSLRPGRISRAASSSAICRPLRGCTSARSASS